MLTKVFVCMQRTFIAVNKAIVQGKLVVPCNPVGAILPFLVVIAVRSTILSDTANAEGHRFSLFFCILWDLLALSLDHIENWWNILHVLAKHFLRRKCTVHWCTLLNYRACLCAGRYSWCQCGRNTPLTTAAGQLIGLRAMHSF